MTIYTAYRELNNCEDSNINLEILDMFDSEEKAINCILESIKKDLKLEHNTGYYIYSMESREVK